MLRGHSISNLGLENADIFRQNTNCEGTTLGCGTKQEGARSVPLYGKDLMFISEEVLINDDKIN